MRKHVLTGIIFGISMALIGIAATPSHAAPLSGRRIVVDPGHGGWDPGAKGPTGLREKDVNLRVATSLRNILVEYGGAQVKMTRTDDRYLALTERARIANAWGGQRFISIHHNANNNRAINGTEVYSHTNSSWASKDLRNKVQARLVQRMGLRNIGAKTANFSVLRNTHMPSILTEASFISNPYEEARLKNPSYVWKQAFAIYQGVVDHMGK